MPGETPLRVLSCGSVDDGKSTLIGRLLHDCGALYEDQLALLERERTVEGLPDFSRLLDGLLAEREQAITIDVAYRTFRLGRRRYLVADAPGHEQYTRNMVTGASRADLALILVDAVKARSGFPPQTIRHTVICSMMGVADLVVAVNKMDCLGYEREPYAAIEGEYRRRIQGIPFRSVTCVPVSALKGDNVARLGPAMAWYDGPTILELLEKTEPLSAAEGPFRLPVQWVARGKDFRGLSGTILSGRVEKGSRVVFQPSGSAGTVRRLLGPRGELERAGPEEAVCLQLQEDLDVGRGEIITGPEGELEVADNFAARLIWLNEPALARGRQYIFRLAQSETRATITELTSKLDMETLRETQAKALRPNDIGRVKINLERPLPFTSYQESRDLGGFLLVDRQSGQTLAAGLIEYALRRSHLLFPRSYELNKKAQGRQKGQTPRCLWFTGLSASGKSTLAELAARALHAQGRHIYILDGDNLRVGLNSDLGFTETDRAENIRRVSEVARLMVDAGLIVLVSLISPYRGDRAAARERFAPGEFVEIFVDTPLSVCVARDPKGLYARALDGRLPNFTGISAPFEVPENPEIRLDGQETPEKLAEEILNYLAALKENER